MSSGINVGLSVGESTSTNGRYAFAEEQVDHTYIADSTNYLTVLSGASAGESIGLEAGVYTDGLVVPSNITIASLYGVGTVNFVGGDNAWEAIIQLPNIGGVIDGLIAHDPDNSNSNAIQVDGTYNQVLNCGAYNGGTHKHKIPCIIGGNYNLIEDSFFFGLGRYTIQTFTSEYNTIRRCVARWDSTIPGDLSEPNAAFSNYNSNNNTWENCISIDYNSTPEPMRHGGDFYAPHHISIWPNGNRDNKWLGCAVAYHDRSNDAGDNNNFGFRSDPDPTTTCINNVIKDFFIRDMRADFGISTYFGVTITNLTRELITAPLLSDGTFGSSGSSLDSTNPADIDYKYIDGVKTDELVFPFKHEAIMKEEMAKVADGSRGWVGSGKSLHDYVKGI